LARVSALFNAGFLPPGDKTFQHGGKLWVKVGESGKHFLL
jgi:hypothetical protein